MKRALLALLLCVSLPASAANLHSYPPDVSAVPWGGAGAPSSGSWAEGAMVVDTSGDVYVCTVAGTPGTWVSLGGGGVAGITAAGTVSDSWTTNTDYAAGDDEDPSLVLRGGDAAGETNSVFLTTLKQISDGAGTVINTLTTTDDGAATGTAFLIGAFGSVANVGSVLLISAGSGILNHTFEIEVTTAGVVNFKSAAGLNGFVFALGSTFSDTLTVTNLTTLNGSVELGGGATDSISWNGVLDTDIVPDAPNTRSLGAASTDYLAVYTRAVTAGTGASLALSSNGGAWNLGGGTGSVFSSTGVADSSVQLTLGKSTAFLADTDVDATLHFRGHQVGDALGLATTASIALDASGDALVISPPVNGTTFSGGDLLMDGGNIQLAALATVDGVDVSALDSSVSTHTGDTGNPHFVTAAQAGALAIADCNDANTVWGCTADNTAAILTPAQIRSAAALDSSAAGAGASTIALEDSAANFTTDNVEAALAQLAAASGGTPPPVYLGELVIDHSWEQAQSTNIQYNGATYDWSTTGRSFGFAWPYTRLTAAHASWGLEVYCRIAAAQTDTAVAFDLKARGGTEYGTEWTDSTWTGSLTEESSTITFSGSLPTADDYLFVGWHSDGTDILRVFYCAAYAVPL